MNHHVGLHLDWWILHLLFSTTDLMDEKVENLQYKGTYSVAPSTDEKDADVKVIMLSDQGVESKTNIDSL